MEHFSSEYFILLTEDELSALVKAKNRDDFQPELKEFLYAAKRLKQLRQLPFDSGIEEWVAPQLILKDGGEVFDKIQRRRGHREVHPLPARPGEPQMALSYDWFWDQFCAFLRDKRIWAYRIETQLILVCPEDVPFSIEEEWANFWSEISSMENLKQSIEVFLNNKTLFKKQAKPWDSKDIPILSEDMARYLIHYYQDGKSKKKHFKQGSIPKAIAELEEVIQSCNYASIPFNQASPTDHVQGGDFFLGQEYVRCAACGEIIRRRDGLKRLAIFIKDSDERPQSGRHKDDLNIFCKRCIATVFLCPVKLAPETLTVRFLEAQSSKGSATPERSIETELKKYVAQSLHVHAGNFVSLHLTESVDRKPLCQIWGAYHYALWKMAVTFPPELFAQGFSVEAYPGEETFRLPRWSLWFVSSLAAWDGVFRYNCYGKKDFRPHFAQFLRLVARKKIFQALYVLISGQLIGNYAQSWRINQLQDIWKEFETILKEDKMPTTDYRRIAGFVGLLLPLAERVQASRQSDDEKRTAIKKLLEEVDQPIQYAYTAARESGYTDFILCKSPGNRYFYEKAIELLKWAGEEIANLENEAERLANKYEKLSWAKDVEDKVCIRSDQIVRVAGSLRNENEKPYKNETDWRAFAYQVKLALWSMFPKYLGSRN
ncbi:MAG: hypothetical protein JW883_02215 [Deltaproteobacteria bacterium]|nr:hypothetical protein [Deltaproteobacteria bacterium]